LWHIRNLQIHQWRKLTTKRVFFHQVTIKSSTNLRLAIEASHRAGVFYAAICKLNLLSCECALSANRILFLERQVFVNVLTLIMRKP